MRSGGDTRSRAADRPAELSHEPHPLRCSSSANLCPCSIGSLIVSSRPAMSTRSLRFEHAQRDADIVVGMDPDDRRGSLERLGGPRKRHRVSGVTVAPENSQVPALAGARQPVIPASEIDFAQKRTDVRTAAAAGKTADDQRRRASRRRLQEDRQPRHQQFAVAQRGNARAGRAKSSASSATSPIRRRARWRSGAIS